MPVTRFGAACATPGCNRPPRPGEKLCAMCWHLSRLTGRPPAGEPDRRPSLIDSLHALTSPQGDQLLEDGRRRLNTPRPGGTP